MTDAVYVSYVTVGRATREAVPEDRVGLYRWLSATLLGRNRVTVHAKNLFVSNMEMKSAPSRITRLLHDEVPDEAERAAVNIIDLSDNPYHLLWEEFLLCVADAAELWLSGREKQLVVVLLPRRPPRASLFWHPFADLPAKAGQASRLFVIDNGGGVEPSHPGMAFPSSEYVLHRAAGRGLVTALTDQLRQRIVRRPGHFDFGGHDDPHCAHYFFTAERADKEIGELIINWVNTTLRPLMPSGEPLTLASYGRQHGLSDAVAGAAAVLGCSIEPIPYLEPMPDLSHRPGRIALVFDVVNTGDTFRRVVRELTASGAVLAPAALAVMVTDGDPPDHVNGTRLMWLSSGHRRETVDQKACEQCRLGLPFTPVAEEGQVRLRAFDMWRILFNSPWKREAFGSPHGRQYESVPDMLQIFEANGNLFAHKVYSLLCHLGAEDELVFVCPAERNVEELLSHLGVLLQNKQVAVRVPTPPIRGRNWKAEVNRRSGEDWHRQLRHLRDQQSAKIIIIDEFAGSKTTARNLVRLLRHFQLEPLAYIPVLDFCPGEELNAVPTYPLYSIPLPRMSR